MNQHPIIQAMKNAGSITQCQAQWLVRTNYGDNETGVRVNMARLADALVHDWTGVDRLNDQHTLNNITHPDRANANLRRDLRLAISEALVKFPVAYREHLIDQLAAGNGAEEAEALRITSDRQLAILLNTIRANVDSHATAAS